MPKKRTRKIAPIAIYIQQSGSPPVEVRPDHWLHALVASFYGGFRWDKKRITRKAAADAKRTAASKAKAARAQVMYREWYLHLPKSERPKKADVEANIAHRLNIEFPGSPTKPRTVRFYLVSKNSENF